MYREHYRRRERSRSPHHSRPFSPEKKVESFDYNHGQGSRSGDKYEREYMEAKHYDSGRGQRSSYSGDTRRSHRTRDYSPDYNFYDSYEDYDPRVALFREELEYLDGEIDRERNYNGVGYDCEVCRISVTSVKALQTHFAGAKHQRALAKRGISSNLDDLVKLPKDRTVQESIMRCTLCNVIVQGTEINVHSASEQHQEMLTKLTPRDMMTQLKGEGETSWYELVTTCKEDPDNNRFECTLCSVVLPRKDLFEIHLKGKKHNKRLRWKDACERDPDDGGYEGAQFWCGICGIFCCSADALDKHFSGKQHAKMLRAKGVSEDQIQESLPDSMKIYPNGHEVKPSKPPQEDLLVKSEQKPKKGLYGSLPEVLVKQKCKQEGTGIEIKPVMSAFRPSTSGIKPKPPTEAKPKKVPYPNPTPRNTNNSNPNPLSVGAFLQSINGEDPALKKTEDSTEPVTSYLNKIRYQHSFGAVPGSSSSGHTSQQQPSIVEQLASKKHFAKPCNHALIQYPLYFRQRRY